MDVEPVHSSWFPAGLILDLEELLGQKVDVVTEDSIRLRAAVKKNKAPNKGVKLTRP